MKSKFGLLKREAKYGGSSNFGISSGRVVHEVDQSGGFETMNGYGESDTDLPEY